MPIPVDISDLLAAQEEAQYLRHEDAPTDLDRIEDELALAFDIDRADDRIGPVPWDLPASGAIA